MSQKLEGLWLGGEISREAAEIVETVVQGQAWAAPAGSKVRAELFDLSNAVRAQIQKLPPPPKPVCDLI